MQRRLTPVCACAAVIAVAAPGVATAQQSGWDDDFAALPEIARHAVVLPPMEVSEEWYASGLVLFFESTGNARIWDPETETTLGATWSPGVNLFCSGHAIDGFGRVVFSGGATGTGGQCGIEDVKIADPMGNNVSRVMDDGRWYPTCITDADGNVWFFSGNVRYSPDDPPDCDRNLTVEWLDIHNSDAINMISNLTLDPTPPTYPKAHLLGTASDGNIAFVGPGVGDVGQTFWFQTATAGAGFIDGPETALSWFNEEPISRIQSTSVLLPVDLRQDPPVEEVLVIGGSADFGQGFELTATCEILRYDSLEEDWVWVFTGDPEDPDDPGHISHTRQRADVVLLADGTPFLVGGVEEGQYDCPVFTPERFVDGEWEDLPNHEYPRGYHSVAVLLRDGSVWVAGQDEDSECGQTTYTHGGDQVEIYRPWYFDEDRPEITSPAGSPPLIDREDPFNVTYSLGQGRSFGYVALIALGSVTHSTNFSQRYVILENVEPVGNTVEVDPPPAAFAPPGPYMLVVVDDAGVPSVAEFVYLDFE